MWDASQLDFDSVHRAVGYVVMVRFCIDRD